MTRTTGVVLAGLLLLAGCSSSGSGGKPANLSVCADALDAADAGFDALAANIRQVQAALDEAFNGDLAAARQTLAGVSRVNAGRYKTLERECRAAVR